MGRDFEYAPASDVAWIYGEVKGYYQVAQAKLVNKVDVRLINKQAYTFTATYGMTDFVTRLAEKLQPEVAFNLNHKLMSIAKEHGKYILTFQEGDVEKVVYANYVIMAIPFSTLRYVTIDDTVGLSDLHKKAINELTYGYHSKVGVEMVGEVDLYDQILYYFNLDNGITGWPGQQTLTLFVDGEESIALNEERGKELGQQNADCVAQLYKGKSIGRTMIKNWNVDPFARGSYSSSSIDQDPMICKISEQNRNLFAYADPVDNFFFAGEHTVCDNSGHIEGAVCSGKIAAASLKNIMPCRQKRSRDVISFNHEGDDCHVRKTIKVARTKSL